MGNFNWVDYVVIGVFFISILGGLMRGMIKEVLNVLTWIAAFFIASMFSTQLANAFTGSSSVQSIIASSSSTLNVDTTHQASLISLGLSFVALFVGTLIVGSIISYFVTRAADSVGMGLINRLLGGAFGILRGYLVVLVAFFVVELTPIAAQAFWGQSQFVNSFDPQVKWLGEIVQPGLDTLKDKMKNTLQNVNSQFQQGVMNIYNGNGR